MSKKFVLFLFLFLYPLTIEAREIKVPEGKPTFQEAVNVANNGDTIILKGKCLLNESVLIKDKENISIIAKGKVILTNRKSAAIVLENSIISIKGIDFFRDEVAISISSSVLSITKCSFEKNRIGVEVINSALVVDDCSFEINYFAGILSIGKENVVKPTPSNNWKNNYIDIYSCPTGNISEGTKIMLGPLSD